VSVDSYITFEQAAPGSNSFPYLILSGVLFEVGIGTYTTIGASGTTYGVLNRNTVLYNSNLTTSLINFAGVYGDVIITNPAELAVLVNSQPTQNTKRVLKWINSQYQLLETVENADALGASIGSSIIFYNWSTTGFNADPKLQFYPGDTAQVFVDGILQATAKAFKIKHPTKDEGYLMHGCLEGPEYGIYLRGNTQTNNSIKIFFPDYFNALSNNITAVVTSESYIPFKYILFDGGIQIKLLFPWIKKIKFSYIIIASRTDVLFKLET
jgi:hypothetical protein